MLINRWFILGVLFIARFVLGFQFQSAGSVTLFIVQDFDVDYTGVGTLVGLYMLPGLFLSVPSGFIGRRFGDKRIVLIGLTMMLLGGAIAGAADSYSTVVVARLISGGGAAFLFVFMLKMLTDWFVDRELFIGMSIYIIGWPIGIAAGQAVQASIAAAISWNFVFYLTAMGCTIALLAVAILYRTPPGLEDKPTGSFLKLSRRELSLVTIAGLVWMFINGAYVVLLSFAPIFLFEKGVSFEKAGVVVSLMSWVFIFSLPLGGYLATRLKAPNVVMFSGLIGTIIIGGLIPYTNVPFVTFLLFGILYAVSAPVVASLPVEVLNPGNRGPGFGIYYIWYYAGSALLPVVGGYLKDITGTAASSVLFGVALMITTTMLVGLFRLAQARFPVRAEMDA
jgi:predicted MFS family arabinose efflux permease